MLLAAAGLCVGQSAWAVTNMTTMTGLLGLEDNSNDFGAYATKSVTIAAGESYTYTFVNYNKGNEGTDIWENWVVEGRRSDNNHCFDFRADGGFWTWKPDGDDAVLLASYTGNTSTDVSATTIDWLQAYNGITVTVTISRSNDGNTIIVDHSATTNTSVTYSGTFTCTGFSTGAATIILTNENSHQRIQKVVYTSGTDGIIYTSRMTHISGTDADKGTSYGEEYTATTGYNKISNTVELANSGWGVNNIVYVQVDATDVPNEATITAATLALSAQESANQREHAIGVGYNSSVWSATMTWNTATRAITTIGATKAAAKNSTTALSYDIIAGVSKGNATTFLIYDTAAGGCTLSNVTATITFTTETTYTASFTETNSLSPAVTIYSDAGMTSEITNGTLEDGTTYYYKAVLYGYNDVTGNFTVSGANPSINITMTAKETYSYSYKYKLGTADAVEQASGTKYVDETVTIYYPVCRQDASDNYYVVSKNNSAPYFGVVISSSNNDVTVNYTLDEDIVYYAESENMSGSRYSSSQAASYTSNGGSYCSVNSENSYIATNWSLAAGNYDIEVGMAGRYAVSVTPKLQTSSTDASPTTLESISVTAGTSLSQKTYFNQSIATGQNLYIFNDNGSYASKWALDYVIVRTSPTTVPATVGATGFATFSNANYALDFTGLAVKAYKATLTGETEKTVLLTPVTEVPANTGVLLKGAADTYNIPVIASAAAIGDNLFVASADANIAASTGSTYHYVLAKHSGNVGFYNLATAKNIGAGKAYLETTTELKDESGSGSRTAWVFADDETTGINTVNGSESKVNGSDIYDLQGRRVAQPAKGLYIVNGKKVVIK